MIKVKFENELPDEAREFLLEIDEKVFWNFLKTKIMEKKMKKYSFNEIKDEFLGKKGTAKRDEYEYDLQMDVLGEIIKQTRFNVN